MEIFDILKKRILVLDGAMGTMIQRYDLGEDDFRNEALKDHPSPLMGNNDLLALTRPDVLFEIHCQYLEVGADIIETNTFSSTTIAQADYGLEHLAYELNYESAVLAKKACDKFSTKTPDKPRFVAGSIGPTNRTASMSPDVNNPGFRAVSFDELRIAYAEQAKGLIEGGADLLLVETIFDTLNAKAALVGIQETFDLLGKELPIMVSGTITDASGRTLSGQTTEAFLISVSHFNLLSVGLNCALGASQLKPYLEILSNNADFNVSAHPNAGLPNEFGEYDETPELLGAQIKAFLDDGLVNIIGGCCGTTPEHIAEIVRLVDAAKPRELKKSAIDAKSSV